METEGQRTAVRIRTVDESETRIILRGGPAVTLPSPRKEHRMIAAVIYAISVASSNMDAVINLIR